MLQLRYSRLELFAFFLVRVGKVLEGFNLSSFILDFNTQRQHQIIKDNPRDIRTCAYEYKRVYLFTSFLSKRRTFTVVFEELAAIT